MGKSILSVLVFECVMLFLNSTIFSSWIIYNLPMHYIWKVPSPHPTPLCLCLCPEKWWKLIAYTYQVDQGVSETGFVCYQAKCRTLTLLIASVCECVCVFACAWTPRFLFVSRGACMNLWWKVSQAKVSSESMTPQRATELHGIPPGTFYYSTSITAWGSLWCGIILFSYPSPLIPPVHFMGIFWSSWDSESC